MKKILSAVLALSLLSLTGCAKSSGVMPMSPDVYALTVDMNKSILTGASDAEQQAYGEALTFCDDMGKELRVYRFRHTQSWRLYTVTLFFGCVPGGVLAPHPETRKVDVEML